MDDFANVQNCLDLLRGIGGDQPLVEKVAAFSPETGH